MLADRAGKAQSELSGKCAKGGREDVRKHRNKARTAPLSASLIPRSGAGRPLPRLVIPRSPPYGGRDATRLVRLRRKSRRKGRRQRAKGSRQWAAGGGQRAEPTSPPRARSRWISRAPLNSHSQTCSECIRERLPSWASSAAFLHSGSPQKPTARGTASSGLSSLPQRPESAVARAAECMSASLSKSTNRTKSRIEAYAAYCILCCHSLRRAALATTANLVRKS